MTWPKGNQWENQDFYTFERKCGAEEAWPDYSHPSLTDPRIMKCIDAALAAYRVIGCRDIGRVDVRFDKKGGDATPVVMEASLQAQIHSPQLILHRFSAAGDAHSRNYIQSVGRNPNRPALRDNVGRAISSDIRKRLETCSPKAKQCCLWEFGEQRQL
ncbi:hypothetical protein M407DRAFT_33363 [Tulasnella calospora MUT 4182]|uniref:Uncharacterized protein n=1 Tax=Tulasnella calospora MUT 4182 TaxID=1051891 RepID=A0A0C3K6J2_9AGAM|nr:hypothetical protein M407DRAFT_33363 [Tulasnella calospora MUT 4182]